MSSRASIIHWSLCLLIVFPRFVCVRVGTSFWLVLVLQRVLSFCRCSKCMLSTKCCIWLSQIQLTPFLGVKKRGKLVFNTHSITSQPKPPVTPQIASFSCTVYPLTEALWVKLLVCECAHLLSDIIVLCTRKHPMGLCSLLAYELHRGPLYVGTARGSESVHA